MPASSSVAKRPPWRPWVAEAPTPPASTFASIAGTTWGAAVAGLQRASGFLSRRSQKGLIQLCMEVPCGVAVELLTRPSLCASVHW